MKIFSFHVILIAAYGQMFGSFFYCILTMGCQRLLMVRENLMILHISLRILLTIGVNLGYVGRNRVKYVKILLPLEILCEAYG